MTTARSPIDVDPVTLSLVRGALVSATHELGLLIERTSMSPFINEKHDYLIGFADVTGRYVTLDKAFIAGTNLVRPVSKYYPIEQMRPGDLYWFNDAYQSDGAISHSPDLAFIAPAFHENVLIGFCASYGHCWDIGGLRPGSLSPDATDIFQEGVIVPPVRVVRDGVWNDELLRMFLRNSRYPELVRGDIGAMTSAARLGEARLAELADRFGREVLVRSFERLLEQGSAVLRADLNRLVHDGAHIRFGDAVDSDGLSDRPYWVRLELSRRADKITIDATASDDQAVGPINLLLDKTTPVMNLAMNLARHDSTFLLNAGGAAIVDEVVLRTGSILAPRFPASIGSRGITMRMVGSAVQGLVAQITDGFAPAASPAYDLYVLRAQDPQTGQPLLVTDGLGVGRGASPSADGADAIYSTAQKNFPCEYMELNFPLRMEQYAISCDSGGPGRHRGGCGVVREFTFLGDTAELAVRLGNTAYPAWGVNGGHGAPPESVVVNPGAPNERVLKPLSDGNRLLHGDVVRIRTGGGGGWGHPLDREPERVQGDVRNGFVSLQSAYDDYGVCLDGATLEIDVARTDARRTEPRSAVEMFHRGGYLAEIW